jgi:hypothetical protein
MVRPTFIPWCGAPVPFDFGRKPVLDHCGEPCFAELAIVRDLRACGWNAVWTEAYGGLRYWETMPKAWSAKSDVTIPAELDALVRVIQKAGKTSACFDVLAWRGDQILIAEAKRGGKDRLTKAQLRFIEGALKLNYGIFPDCFLIVEWTLQTPG